MPPNIRTLNVSYNQLRRFDSRIVPVSLVELDVSYNFLKSPPDVGEQCHLEHRGNEYLWNPPAIYITTATAPSTQPKSKVVYKNKQNVHASSVQNGINASVRVIIEATFNMILPKDVVEYTLEYLGIYKDSVEKQQPPWKKWWKKCTSSYQPKESKELFVSELRAWCKNQCIHSMYGISFSEILARVVFLARNHPNADTLRDILHDELEQSVGQCFTGRFSRVVNVLVGFVNGVEVGIDPREQLQARMAALSTSGKESFVMLEHAMDILTEFGNENEWKAWIDALVEYTPQDIFGILAADKKYPRRQWLSALVTDDVEKLYKIFKTCGITFEWIAWLDNSIMRISPS